MNSRRDVRQEIDGREDAGCTRQYGSGVRRPGESFCHSNQSDGDGDATMDGNTRSGSEDDRGYAREDNSESGCGRASKEFEVEIGLRKGSVLRPLPFKAVLTGPHQQEYGDEGRHDETPLCRRPDPGGEWQTGAT